MATSSIFYNVEINDRSQAERFIAALEESEEAQTVKKTVPAIPIIRDADEIRKLMTKRFSRISP